MSLAPPLPEGSGPPASLSPMRSRECDHRCSLAGPPRGPGFDRKLMGTSTPHRPSSSSSPPAVATTTPSPGACARPKREFGPAAAVSDAFDFTETDYYAAEMGAGLKKQFWVFAAADRPRPPRRDQARDQPLGSRIRRRCSPPRAAPAQSRPRLPHARQAGARLDQGPRPPHLSRRRHLRRGHARLPRRRLAAARLDLSRLPPRRLPAFFTALPRAARAERSAPLAPRVKLTPHAPPRPRIERSTAIRLPFRLVAASSSISHLARHAMKNTLSLVCSPSSSASPAAPPLATGKPAPGPSASATSPPQRRRASDAARGRQPSPHAVVAETTFNFDNMESGTTQRHVFPIRNDGRRPAHRQVRFAHLQVHRRRARRQGGRARRRHRRRRPATKPASCSSGPPRSPPGPFRHGATFTTNDPGSRGWS